MTRLDTTRKRLVYTPLMGKPILLSQLKKEEWSLLGRLTNFRGRLPRWGKFNAAWMEAFRESDLEIGHPIFTICQDIEYRLQIEQGDLAFDVRDQLYGLIKSRYRSLREFCRKAGVNSSQLNRVLLHREDFSLKTFEKLLDLFGLVLSLKPKEEVKRETSVHTALHTLQLFRPE